MHPWRNRIAHQIPILTVGGSNPFGCAIQNAEVFTSAFFIITRTDSIPDADAIGAERNNRYYARRARYVSVWVRQKNLLERQVRGDFLLLHSSLFTLHLSNEKIFLKLEVIVNSEKVKRRKSACARLEVKVNSEKVWNIPCYKLELKVKKV